MGDGWRWSQKPCGGDLGRASRRLDPLGVRANRAAQPVITGRGNHVGYIGHAEFTRAANLQRRNLVPAGVRRSYTVDSKILTAGRATRNLQPSLGIQIDHRDFT